MTDDEGKVAIHSTEPELIPKVIAFLQSRTYFEKEQLLRRHPELLGDEADHILEQIESIWKSAGNDNRAEGVSTWREFLRRVADSDFELAMLEGIILSTIMGVMDQQGDILRITSDHPELLSDRTDEAMLSVKRKLGGDESPIAEVLDFIRTAIQEQKSRKGPVREGALKKLDESKYKEWKVSDLFK
jgi:hypothetical protein